MNNATTSPQVIVSLTSFPAAIPYAVEAIRSVLNGSVLPDKVVLYLDTQKFPDGILPTELEDLKEDIDNILDENEVEDCDTPEE